MVENITIENSARRKEEYSTFNQIPFMITIANPKRRASSKVIRGNARASISPVPFRFETFANHLEGS